MAATAEGGTGNPEVEVRTLRSGCPAGKEASRTTSLKVGSGSSECRGGTAEGSLDDSAEARDPEDEFRMLASGCPRGKEAWRITSLKVGIANAEAGAGVSTEGSGASGSC